MFKRIFYICNIFLFSLGASLAEKKDVKILILIITSDSEPVYQEHIKIWRSYMNLMPNNIKAYFIKGNPNLKNRYEIHGDTIYSKTEENVIPGVLNKTILSLCALKDEIENEYDFVLRTNLSSFFVFSKLVDYCKNVANKNYLGGAWLNNSFLWYMRGSCILFSSDLAVKMIQEAKIILETKASQLFWDDMLISDILRSYGANVYNIPVYQQEVPYFWRNFFKEVIEKDVFYIRCKNYDPALRESQELPLLRHLRNFHYPNYNS